MAKVSDMLGDFAEPRGDAGYSVPIEDAMAKAQEIRDLLLPMCIAAREYDRECDHDLLIAAWAHLNARERRTWKELVSCGYAHP